MRLWKIEVKIITTIIFSVLTMFTIYSFCSSIFILFRLNSLERRKQKAFSELLAREKKLMADDLDAGRKKQADAYRELFRKLQEAEKNSGITDKPAAGLKGKNK